MTIAPERIDLALDRLDFSDGFEFETFATLFLASEFPNLRPVGGMHDGGRDAFLYRSQDQEDVFVQHSVSRDWSSKIQNTLKSLNKNGHTVRELIYCSPKRLQAEADTLRTKLRENGVSLDIRDRPWFVAFANTSVARQEAAERLAKRYVDPLLPRPKSRLLHSLSLTSDEERIATVFLELELEVRASTKGLTRVCYESLVRYLLIESSSENPVELSQLEEGVLRILGYGGDTRVSQLIRQSLNRLVTRGVVNHHTKEDAYTLAHADRMKIRERNQRKLHDEVLLKDEIGKRLPILTAQLGVDYSYEPEAVASDSLRLLDSILSERSRAAALALSGSDQFHIPRQTITQSAEQLLNEHRTNLECVDSLGDEKFLDLVPVVIEDVLRRPTAAIASRLRATADAYCLLFLLQKTPDVQKAFGKILDGTRLLIDTSILIPCLAERPFPAEERRLTNLLSAAKQLGFDLVYGEDVLNEVETHLVRVRNSYYYTASPSDDLSARSFSPGALIESYRSAKARGLLKYDFNTFIGQFMGNVTPKEDILDYLQHELGLRYDEMEEEYRSIPQDELGELFAEWKKRKPRRPWVDDQAFETLVWHDAKAYLLVRVLRERDLGNTSYGSRWWWLVSDGSAFSFDRSQKFSTGQGMCMSPEFFARYLSLVPKSEENQAAVESILPTCIDVAALGMIPPELREEAQAIYDSTKDEPEYMRRRRLRDLVNRAIGTDAPDETLSETE